MNDQETVDEITRLLAHRDFKFTVTFEGLEPIQAYGRIDNQRFYYRQRGNIMSLKAGGHRSHPEKDYYPPVEKESTLKVSENKNLTFIEKFIRLTETLEKHA